MAYAEYTKVPVDQTRGEIERTLRKYGADNIVIATASTNATIIFEMSDRRIRFDLPLPAGTKEDAKRTQRQRWRALLLCIKAKLESVESKIETFDESFMSHVVMPDGKTAGQHAIPMIASAYKSGTMQPLLPPPGR